MNSISQQALESNAAPTVNLKALNYRNDRIIARLIENDGLSEEEAKLLFDDTLKFLALTDNPFKLSPSPKIDLGWHNFILHTREYAEFCESCFGHFVHHEPGSGLTQAGAILDVIETAQLAQTAFGNISTNWESARGATCGSGGC